MSGPYDKQTTSPQPAKLNARAASWVGLFVGLCLGVALSWMAPANAARNGSGTYSLPNTGSVPNPVVTGTTITSTWANGTLSDISTEITNSLDRGGRGAMTAPLQLASGSVSAPGLTFSGDTNSGLYRVGADDMALVTAGTNRLEVSTTAITGTLPVVVTSSVTNGTAIKGTGDGTGNGVEGVASGAAYGVLGTAGATGTYGGRFVGSTAGGTALMSVAQQAGLGAYLVGGASTDGGSAGGGVLAVGGASTGGIGGIGLTVNGGAGSSVANAGVGLYAAPGNTSTGSARSTAIQVVNGDIDLDGVANIDSNKGVTNRLTPSNLPKAWGIITCGASPSVTAGFNIDSATCGTNKITVNIADDMSSADYVCLVQHTSSLLTCSAIPSSGGVVVVDCVTSTTGAAVNLCAASYAVNLVCFGNQ